MTKRAAALLMTPSVALAATVSAPAATRTPARASTTGRAAPTSTPGAAGLRDPDVTSSAAGLRDPEFTPGAAGLGDTYFPDAGNGGYDASHYAIDLAYRPKSRRIRATTTVTATATQNLSRFDLDFIGNHIDDLRVDGVHAGYARHGQELVITPPKGIVKGSEFTVTVRYAGRPHPLNDPSLGQVGWLSTSDGATALSEPTGSPTWFPLNDHPSDKATYEYRVTVPKGLTALANGEPHGTVRRAGTSTFSWSSRRPMAGYLALLAIGRFVTRQGRSPGGVRTITAMDVKLAGRSGRHTDRRPDRHADRRAHSRADRRARSRADRRARSRADRSVRTQADRGARRRADLFQAVTARVTDWEASVFGRFPFGSTGGIVDDAPAGYSLETQNRPVYTGAANTTLIVHELAHQWFGDSVSLEQWKDIWLNEGFATYAEWLYLERHGGPSAARNFAVSYRRPASDPAWRREPGDPGRKGLFDSFAVYERGAMTLQALRRTVGDSAFFATLRAWASEHAYGTGSTPQFIALAERLSHRDLGPLFQSWLYTPNKPKI
ncbi:M1 family metallopeptidase [Actinomadura gamaensis]|uniref:M1 family metallopeptidase n=1 Tax=Actinomadura gamaensis TaxID=1763541 RepID=A0ABV9U6T3_9ACTN